MSQRSPEPSWALNLGPFVDLHSQIKSICHQGLEIALETQRVSCKSYDDDEAIPADGEEHPCYPLPLITELCLCSQRILIFFNTHHLIEAKQIYAVQRRIFFFLVVIRKIWAFSLYT